MMPFIAFPQAPGAERDQEAAIRDSTYVAVMTPFWRVFEQKIGAKNTVSFSMITASWWQEMPRLLLPTQTLIKVVILVCYTPFQDFGEFWNKIPKSVNFIRKKKFSAMDQSYKCYFWQRQHSKSITKKLHL